MSEERLQDLILLQAHRDRVTALSVDNIFYNFAINGSRKLDFVFQL